MDKELKTYTNERIIEEQEIILELYNIDLLKYNKHELLMIIRRIADYISLKDRNYKNE